MPDLRPAVAEIERVVPKAEKPHKCGIPAWGWTSAGIGATVFYVAFYLYSISRLMAAWRSGSSDDWDLFWHNPASILVVYPAFLFFMRQTPSNPFAHWGRLAEAHWKALEDDGAHIPLAEPQPTSDPDDSPAITRRVLTPLLRPGRLRDTGAIAVAAVLIVLASVLAIITVVVFSAWIDDRTPAEVVATLILSGITLCSAMTAYALLRWCRRTSTPISVTVDEEGLYWRESTGRRSHRHIAWHEARAFVTFSWRVESTWTTYTVYALIAPGAVFTWELTQRANRKERLAHEELAGLILARTGLPLRTLTDTFAAALAVPAAPEKPKIQFPLGTPGTPDAVPGIPPVITTPELPEVAARARRRQFVLRALAGATVLPLLLLNGAGMYLQREQPHYFASYLARAEAQSPIFLDTMNEDEGIWTVQQDSPSTPGNLFYTEDAPLHGVYELSGPDPQSGLYSWSSQSFANAVVEVTARQLHNPMDDATDGVGLGLRTSSDGNQYVQFTVDPAGYWAFGDYPAGSSSASNLNDIDGGTSDAIHQGVGAVNRLAVVMHGNDFTLYVNGQFLAVETVSDALASGPAGVYISSEATGGQFYDFAVYPLPADPPLLRWG